MIKEVSGDVLLSKAQAIAHGVAPFDHFDSGLALSLREEWPSMFKDFKHYCSVQNPQPGGLWVWTGANGQRIINLLTQEPSQGKGHNGHPGTASLTNVGHALHELKKVIEKEGLKSVAIPRLATGVGRLKWEDVRQLIYHHLENTGADVYVYVNYEKGKAAE
jgi:O-acetyl-ADP-ribose deacetylase (regulator of RNase III)